MPFPIRPARPEELELETGDYEALPPAVASRPPVFARSPYEMRAPQGRPLAFPDGGHPSAPNSLAPMAMQSDRGFDAPITNRNQPPPSTKRPDLRMGVVIAVAGALIGGTLGVAMNNSKRNEARAAADHDRMANAAPALPPTQAMTAMPYGTQAPPVATNPMNAAPLMVPMGSAPPVSPATVPTTAFTAVAVAPPSTPAVRGGRGTTKPPPHVKPPPTGRVTVATGIPDNAPPPPPKTTKPPKSSGGSTEADLLREAISEGGNSLGGTK